MNNTGIKQRIEFKITCFEVGRKTMRPEIAEILYYQLNGFLEGAYECDAITDEEYLAYTHRVMDAWM